MSKSGIKPAATARSAAVASAGAGILPSQAIVRMVAAGEIAVAEPLAEGQVQPASLDLRLGAVAYRVRASFLPRPGRRGAVEAR